MPAANAIKAGEGFVRLSIDNQLTKGLNAAGKRLRSFGAGISAAGIGLAAAGTAIIAPLIKASFDFAKAGSAIFDASKRTGASATFLSEMAFAAEQSGASLGDVTKGMRLLNKATREAGKNKELQETFADIGINFKQFEQLNPEEKFLTAADAISKLGSVEEQQAAANKLFGKSFESILPLLQEGATGIAKLREQGRQSGVTIDKKDAEAADALGDSFDTLKASVAGVKTQIGAALAGTLTDIIKKITDVVKSIVGWVKNNRALVVTVFKVGAALLIAGGALIAIGTAIAGAGFVLTGLGAAFSFLLGVVGAVGSALAFLVSPIGLVIAGAVGLTAWFLTCTKTGQSLVTKLVAGFKFLRDVAVKVFGGISDALAGGDLALAGRIALLGLQVVMLKGLSALTSAVGGSMGDLLGTLGTQLISGDLGGLWETMVSGMAVVWDSFVSGIASTFGEAIKFVIDLWAKSVRKITNLMIEADVTGTFKKQHEQAKKDAATSLQLNQEERQNVLKMIEEFKAGTAQGKTPEQMGFNSNQTLEGLQQRLEASEDGIHRAQVDMGQTLSDFKSGSMDVANQFTGDTASGIKKAIDDAAAGKNLDRSLEAFNKKIAGGAAKPNEALDKATADLDAALADAKRKREEAALAIDTAGEQEEPDDLDLPSLDKTKTGVASLGNVRAIQSLAGIGSRNLDQQQLDQLKGIHRGIRKIAEAEPLVIGP